MITFFIIAGLVLLLLGGESIVRGAVAIARSAGISPLVIGLTIVGFGTSTPELVTSIQAAVVGSPGIAVGNVVGSNTANVLLILGISALLRPIPVEADTFRRDGVVLVVITVAAIGVVLAGFIDRTMGAVFVAGLIGYIGWLLWQARPDGMDDELAEMDQPHLSVWAASLYFVGGLIATVAGARLLVDGSVSLARDFGISEAVIGVTIVAVGTSLPELVTSLIAAWRGHGAIAFGNVVGSNIYNVAGILGLTAVVHPLAVPPEIINLDIWVMTAATVALIVFAVTGWRVNRWEGAAMLAAYVAYLGYLGSTVSVTI